MKNKTYFSEIPRTPPTPSRGALTLRGILTLLCIAATTAAYGADGCDSQVWLVSTRHISHDCIADVSPQSFHYMQLQDGCWESSDAEAFRTAADPSMPTVIFIHGNATPSREAMTKGLSTYQTIRAMSPDRPMRFVIWSWPAARVLRHLYEDICLKVEYSNVEGYYFAQWLAWYNPSEKVSIIGHSLGARVGTGALHYVAGGEIDGGRLPENATAAWAKQKQRAVRGVFLAAAIDTDWLAPEGRHGRALSQLQEVLLSQNDRDRVLRLYPLIYSSRCGPKALGFAGPEGIGEKTTAELIDVSCSVGRIHNWNQYCAAWDVCQRWAHYAFLEEN